jgi:hypothetical protein
VRDGRLARVLVRSFNCPNLVSRARRTSQGAEARLLSKDGARRIAANIAKLPEPLLAAQTAKPPGANRRRRSARGTDHLRRCGALERCDRSRDCPDAGIRRWSDIPIAIQLAHAGRKASTEVPWKGGVQVPPDHPNG